MVFNTGPYTVLPDNSILITANMQSETDFPSRPSHQLKSYVASKSRLKLAARAVLSADAGLLVHTLSYVHQVSDQFIFKPDSAQAHTGHGTISILACTSPNVHHFYFFTSKLNSNVVVK